MRQIKRKGGVIYILDADGDTCPPGEVGMLADEYEWAKRLAQSKASDPEQLRSFWEGIFEKKVALPGYLIYADYPKVSQKTLATIPAPREEKKPGEFVGKQICADILAALKGKR